MNSMALQNLMIDQAKYQLPRICGDRYARVVVDCLTCVETDAAAHKYDVKNLHRQDREKHETNELREPEAKIFLQDILEALYEIKM